MKGPIVNLVLPKVSFHKPLAVAALAASLLLPSISFAQSQKTDIRPNANQVMGDEIKTIFSGQTHRGSYNFNSQGVARNGYTESHSPDGRVFYDEGKLKANGSWYVANDSLCFLYENESMNGGCFRVYRIQNCFYYYSNQIPRRNDELDRDYWTARSTPKGETPNCEPPLG